MFPTESTNLNDFYMCSARKNDEKLSDSRELELQNKLKQKKPTTQPNQNPKTNQRGKRTEDIREVILFIKVIYAPWEKEPIFRTSMETEKIC